METRRSSLPRAAHAAIRALAFIAFATLCAIAALAQQPRPRIAAPIDNSLRITLAGSVPHQARPEFDLGEAPAGTEMNAMRLLLGRTPEQQAALDRYLRELIDRSSPNYHRWLTPRQFGVLYGPAISDIDATTNWLAAQGFTAISVPAGRIAIQFSGSISLVEQVFHTSIHSFKDGNDEFLSNITDPSIPAALAPVVAAIVHMNTIEPRSYLVAGPRGHFDPASQRLLPVADARTDDASPLVTQNLGGAPFLFLAPADAATLYNTPNRKFNANFSAGASYDGTGVAIGIVGDASIKTSIIANYRKLFVGDAKVPTITTLVCCNSTNGANEAYLDTEVSGALAPGASQHLYLDSNVYSAASTAINDNAVDILNVSFGICEHNITSAENQTIESEWQQAAAQGIAVITASGDSGSTACDSKDNEGASLGLAVSAFTSTPYAVSVGGTDTYALVGDFSTYVSSTNDASAFYRSLLKPIPESTWNDSQDLPGPIAKAQVNRERINAGGGGVSSCSTQSSTGACLSGNAKPSWQSAPGVPPGGSRDVPDVSLMSGPGYDSAAWLICSADEGSCTAETGGGFSFGAVGGTSAAAPAFAGMLAMVEQRTGSRLGQEAVSELYTLARNFGSRVFNDITLGNNAPPCYAPTANLPSPDCVKNSAGNYFESAYNSGPGYDRASGLGSVNATGLVELWGAAAPLPATVTVKPAVSTVFRGHSLAVTITVSGSSGTPTGTVKLTSGTYTSAVTALSAGKATITIPANSLAVGTDTLTVYYSGDTKFNPAAASAKVTVTKEAPTVSVKPASSSTKQTAALVVTVKVSGADATPAGEVTLSSGTYKSTATKLTSGSARITIPAGKLALGSDKLTAIYSGDADSDAAAGHASVNVTK